MKRTQSKADPGNGKKLPLNRETIRDQVSGAGPDPEPFPCTTNSHTTVTPPVRLPSIAG
jgi:hypothetical protein